MMVLTVHQNDNSRRPSEWRCTRNSLVGLETEEGLVNIRDLLGRPSHADDYDLILNVYCWRC
jgi:hypothetical protein